MWRSIRRVGLWAAPGVLASVVALVIAGCGSSSDTADKSATRAYLQAAYVYEQAAAANLPATKRAVEALARRLGRECRGVMAGTEDLRGSSGSFARRVGVSKRKDEQLSELEDELNRAELGTLERSEHQALLTFANAVRSLHWSNPKLTQRIRSEMAELQALATQPIPDVCADMEAWVSSGYKTLSPATKEFRAKREAEAKQGQQTLHTQSIASLLLRYEGPGERALLSKTQGLRKQARKALQEIFSVYGGLEKELGMSRHSRGDESAGRPPAGSVVIDRGRTAAGEKFVARLEPKEPRSSSNGSGCLLPLSINTSGNGMNTCMYRSPSSSDLSDPSVDCASARLTVTINTLPAARSVRLSLSNGGQITSRVLLAPARLGGPAGYYYQVVRGPSPIPVSLTELGAHGRTLRTVTLPHIVECTENPIKYLPGGVQTLVHDRVPNGPAFSITGERYRFLGRAYFELKVHIEESSESGSGGARSSSSFGVLGRKPSMLDWQVETGCHPHPYVILYSVLKAPGNTVFVRTSGKLTAMRRVAVPASLHAGGPLVYTTSIAPSSELVIRTPAGKTILSEKLGSLASEAAAACHGESESESHE